MKILTILTALLCVLAASCKKEDAGALSPKATAASATKAEVPKAEAPKAVEPAAAPVVSGKWMQLAMQGKDLWAQFTTSEGKFVVKLLSKEAPKTVANFVGLVSGEKEYTDPKTKQRSTAPFYDGTIFHRVIPGFMIQGGDRLGMGVGDPGYRFEDEFQSGRKFDKVGLLAMANAGPNTNGSQFFVTVAMPAHLNNRHTIFGETASGYDVVEKISKVQTGPMDRPATPVTVQKIELFEAAP